MEKIKHLLLENKAWSQSKTSLDSEFFTNGAKDQSPDYLWIGCSDSRVPESEVTNTDPGQMFVHRNIANLVQPNDPNLASVIQYAVEALKVKHIIVCGHYNCGGVKASMAESIPFPTVSNWIENIRGTYRRHELEFKLIPNESDRVNRLVELSVITQVKNLMENETIKKVWAQGNTPMLHGWVYDLSTGLLKDLCRIIPGEDTPEFFKS